jgi:hypothetical protein
MNRTFLFISTLHLHNDQHEFLKNETFNSINISFDNKNCDMYTLTIV